MNQVCTKDPSVFGHGRCDFNDSSAKVFQASRSRKFSRSQPEAGRPFDLRR